MNRKGHSQFFFIFLSFFAAATVCWGGAKSADSDQEALAREDIVNMHVSYLTETLDKMKPYMDNGLIDEFEDKFVGHEAQVLDKKMFHKWSDYMYEFHRMNSRNKERYDWKSYFPISNSHKSTVRGQNIYHGFYRKSFQYDAHFNGDTGKLEVVLNLHVRPSAIVARRYNWERKVLPWTQNIVKEATEHWNQSAPEGVVFKVNLVKNRKKAHYAIRITDSSNALYDRYFGLHLSSDEFAHEMGHMLGLNDEHHGLGTKVMPWVRRVVLEKKTISDQYPEIKLTEEIKANDDLRYMAGHYNEKATSLDIVFDSRCLPQSIMCAHKNIFDYHYEIILSRIPPQ